MATSNFPVSEGSPVSQSLIAALQNPAFVEELTGLINQGYWYFDE